METENKIAEIRTMAAELQTDDLVLLAEQLRKLRQFTHDFEYETDEAARKLIEAAAEAKARKLVEAGFTFDAISIDRVRFEMNRGHLVKITAGPCGDGEIPF